MVSDFDERNMARSRERCAAMAERAGRREHVLTARERKILDMWPRFEDGGPVMLGDGAADGDGERFTVLHIEAAHRRWVLKGPGGQGSRLVVKPGERVKRPAPKVLDADGVEIKLGDTVWYRSFCTRGFMREATVIGFGEHNLDGPLVTLKENRGKTWHINPKKITHTRPDSWERLEEDAKKFECEYFGINGLTMRSCRTCPKYDPDVCCDQAVKIDIVRRAKELAGAETVE